jgi:hypothetical protein
LLGGGEGDSARGLAGSSSGLLVAAGGNESHGGGDEVEGVLLPEVLGLDAGNDQTLEEKLIHFTKPKLLVRTKRRAGLVNQASTSTATQAD